MTTKDRKQQPVGERVSVASFCRVHMECAICGAHYCSVQTVGSPIPIHCPSCSQRRQEEIAVLQERARRLGLVLVAAPAAGAGEGAR